jgi:hypothetical protein
MLPKSDGQSGIALAFAPVLGWTGKTDRGVLTGREAVMEILSIKGSPRKKGNQEGRLEKGEER